MGDRVYQDKYGSWCAACGSGGLQTRTDRAGRSDIVCLWCEHGRTGHPSGHTDCGRCKDARAVGPETSADEMFALAFKRGMTVRVMRAMTPGGVIGPDIRIAPAGTVGTVDTRCTCGRDASGAPRVSVSLWSDVKGERMWHGFAWSDACERVA